MTPLLVDASIGIGWVYPSQASADADRILSEFGTRFDVVVPSLWLLEVANGLLAAERRRLLGSRDRADALAALARLPLVIDEESTRNAWGETSRLARKYSLSVYDATYLETASRRRLPLITRDKALRRAASRAGLRTTI